MAKRNVDLIIISDVHLGTYGSHAKELLQYLQSVNPKAIVLNGDIIDIWQFSKSYWPEAHMKVIRRIMKLVTESVPVYYLTGNHDEMLRKFADMTIGSFKLQNKLVLNLSGQKAWIFHGDVFDVTMQNSKWLAKLGATGYDTLILLNRFVNWLLNLIGREKMSFSKRIKESFKDAVKFINNFEITAAELAIENGYSYVICGHIHQPEIKTITTDKGSVTYLNSGDWVENLTALEYHEGQWRIFKYNENDFKKSEIQEDEHDGQDLNALLNIQTIMEQVRHKE